MAHDRQHDLRWMRGHDQQWSNVIHRHRLEAGDEALVQRVVVETRQQRRRYERHRVQYDEGHRSGTERLRAPRVYGSAISSHTAGRVGDNAW